MAYVPTIPTPSSIGEPVLSSGIRANDQGRPRAYPKRIRRRRPRTSLRLAETATNAISDTPPSMPTSRIRSR
jgi:hypothetical protein